jgi:TetR/AcrR family tetracycline transcriptional repressor
MAQPQRREPLSRDRILATAQALARSDGPQALSMRRIAQELDVWPMSLYRHFRDKDELLDALAGEAALGIAGPGAGRSWREDLFALVDRTRAAYAANPAGVRLHREPALRDTGVALLEDAGLGEPEADSAWTALAAYAAGAAAIGADHARFGYGLERLLDGLAARTAPAR